MATTNPAVYRLSIALIVFVLLTFILTISTYLFFSQASKEQQTAKEARDALTKAQGEANQAADEIKRLREVIGADATAKIEDVESGLTSLYENDFNGVAKEPKSYARLVDAIRDEFRAISAARKDVEAAKEQQKKTADEAVAAATKARDDAEKAKADVEKERDSDRSKWQEDWAKHEEELAKRRKETDDASARADQFEALAKEIAKFESYIAVEQRDDFRAKTPMEQFTMFYDEYKKAFREGPPPGIVRKAQNEAVSLKKELQDTLISLDPDQKRTQDVNVVDEVDGSIVEVDSTTRTVTMLFPSARRPREGLAFMVFPGSAVNPLLTDQKGVVRITSAEGRLVRGKILQERAEDPITPNDWVASRLFSAGAAPEAVVIGYVDPARYPIADRAALEALLQRAGAVVGPTVQPTTQIVIDAGPPKERLDDFAQITERRRAELESASKYGNRVISVDEAMRLLGIDPAIMGVR